MEVKSNQQLTYKIVYTCIDVMSSEEDTMENTKHLQCKCSIAVAKFDKKILVVFSFEAFRYRKI